MNGSMKKKLFHQYKASSHIPFEEIAKQHILLSHLSYPIDLTASKYISETYPFSVNVKLINSVVLK